MILDTIDNADRYFSLHPAFSVAFNHLRHATLTPGEKVELDGPSLTVTCSRGQGKRPADAPLEAHRRFIDIHYCIEGMELIGWRSTASCADIRQPYDGTRDFISFGDPPHHWCRLAPGMFLILFPADAHAPMVSNESVTKAVVKIAVDPLGKSSPA